jgi:long-chain fatty acid transport protein
MPRLFRAAAGTCALAIGACALAPAAHASGFELRESSAAAMGTSYAGAAAQTGNPGFLIYNPASAVGVADYDVAVNGAGLLLGTDATYSGFTAAGTPTGGLATPTGFIGDAFVPSLSVRYRIDPQWTVGLSFTVPWGQLTSYPSTWTGRYYAVGTGLTVYNMTPVVAYQATPDLVFAVGAQVEYARSELTQALDFGTIGAGLRFPGARPGAQDGFAELHGHSWGGGWVAGVLWHPMPELSLGLSYRSNVQLVLKGSETFQYDAAGIAATINRLTGAFVNSTGKTDIATPGTVTAGINWQFAGGWQALAGVEYTNWSTVRQLLIEPLNPANPPSLTVLDWKNTWFATLGLEYHPEPLWTLRAGAAYDATAVPAAHLEPRVPGADRYWLSIGAGYRWSDSIDVNFAYSHIFSPNREIAQTTAMPGNALRGNLAGISSIGADLLALEVVIR